MWLGPKAHCALQALQRAAGTRADGATSTALFCLLHFGAWLDFSSVGGSGRGTVPCMARLADAVGSMGFPHSSPIPVLRH